MTKFNVTSIDDEPKEYTVKQVEVPKEVKYISDTKFNPMLRFFKYEDGEIKLNKEELLVIPEARKLIQNDKGGMVKGDIDGRNKRWAFKQFGVAWWLVNINSPGIQSGLEGDELMRDAIKSLEIENWDWKNDTDFLNFLSVYRNMYNAAAYAVMLKQMLMSFNDTSEILKLIRDNSMKILRSNRDLDAEDVKMLMSYQKEIINLAGDIPKQIDKLKDLQTIVYREEKELESGRGNISISKSMLPNE